MRAELNAAHSTTCDRTASSSPSAHYLPDHYAADSHAVDNRGPVTFSRPPQEVSFRVSSLLYIARWPTEDARDGACKPYGTPPFDGRIALELTGVGPVGGRSKVPAGKPASPKLKARPGGHVPSQGSVAAGGFASPLALGWHYRSGRPSPSSWLSFAADEGVGSRAIRTRGTKPLSIELNCASL